jgi:hypothetical protein
MLFFRTLSLTIGSSCNVMLLLQLIVTPRGNFSISTAVSTASAASMMASVASMTASAASTVY